MKKFIAVLVFIFITKVFGITSAQSFLPSPYIATCDEALLPVALYLVQADIPSDFASKLIAQGNIGPTTHLLTFPEGQRITIVVDAFVKGQPDPLPLRIKDLSGKELWTGKVSLSNTSSSLDAERITSFLTFPTIPSLTEGMYFLETTPSGQTPCNTSVQTWFFASPGL